MGDEKMRLFEKRKVRSVWSEENEEWLFSVVDVIGVLTEQTTQRGASDYWAKLKQRLKEDGADELLTNCQQVKMISPRDGKRYKTDVMTTEQILRLIQSVPSKKAEPFRMWLARVGRERIDETIDPELAMERAAGIYIKKGYDEEWVHQRLMAIKIRNSLTNEWRRRGVKKGIEYAILTDEISMAWSGMTTGEYKKYKGLRKENLRDNMSDIELVLTMLSEATTTEIEKLEDPKILKQHKVVAKSGGEVAGMAREAVEKRIGKKVVTSNNAIGLNRIKSISESTMEEE